MQPSHIYIHIPFCAVRCAYCDFYSTAQGTGRAVAYVETLLAELEYLDLEQESIDTVYLGGGTPTLIGADLLEEIMKALTGSMRMSAEVTIEANPSTVTRKLADRLGHIGVNRVSLGVQSFDPRLRKNLGRTGETGEIFKAMEFLRGAGFENVGIDLIFSIPGQGAGELENDIRQALSLKPEHISWYELSAEEGGAYARKWGRELKSARENGPEFYRTVTAALEAAGYLWYETSNFAIPGRACRHNLSYWRGEDYLGVGAGAWSTRGLERWRNVEDIEVYIREKGMQTSSRLCEHLDSKDKLTEKLALGLRMDVGLKRDEVTDLIDPAEERLLRERGYLISEGDRICLTRAGRFVANEICARLLRN
ncbi:MAG: radical SAM family heme chaperone HemW [Thermoleophilia bacterium]|jgi:oxygen-independent coproporphyrinogen-3 oxidase